MASAPLLARAANGLRTKYPLCEQYHSASTTPSICFRQLPIRLRGQANSLAIITMLHLVNNSRPSQWHSHAQHAIFETVNRFTTSQQAIDETTNFNYSLRVIQLYSGTAATTVPSDWLHNICHSFGMHSVAMGKLIATHTPTIVYEISLQTTRNLLDSFEFQFRIKFNSIMNWHWSIETCQPACCAACRLVGRDTDSVIDDISIAAKYEATDLSC